MCLTQCETWFSTSTAPSVKISKPTCNRPRNSTVTAAGSPTGHQDDSSGGRPTRHPRSGGFAGPSPLGRSMCDRTSPGRLLPLLRAGRHLRSYATVPAAALSPLRAAPCARVGLTPSIRQAPGGARQHLFRRRAAGYSGGRSGRLARPRRASKPAGANPARPLPPGPTRTAGRGWRPCQRRRVSARRPCRARRCSPERPAALDGRPVGANNAGFAPRL
jgi:hypothetical protein